MKIPSQLSKDDIEALYGPNVPLPPASLKEVVDVGREDTWAPSLAPKQQEIFDCTARYILAEGERFSGKTWGILHKIVKHCWEYENAHALIIVGVRRQATAGGSWHKLLTDVLPEWKQNLEGFDHSEQKQNTEKDLFVWVRNKHGGWSMIQLISIPHGQSLAARIRGIEASIIFVDELVGIGGPEYFEALIQQIGRRPGIPTEDQQYLAATNPDGPSHWVYKRFHELPKNKETGIWDSKYAWIHVPISENPSPQAKAYYDNVLEATREDPVEYERMILGRWIDRPSGDALFARDFQFNLHVRGDLNAGTVLTPRTGLPITIGYDLGDANHGIVFMQERFLPDKHLWVVFDELVYTDSEVSFEDLVPELLDIMCFWCDWAGYSFTFNHVSDKSAFDRFRAQTGSYDHRQIEQISRKLIKEKPDRYKWLKRSVRLEECPKPQGSVAARIKLLRTMLQREEIVFSANCTILIEAMKFLESEKEEPFKPRRSRHLHPYDALTYPLYYYAMGGSLIPTGVGNVPQITQAGT